MSIPVKSPIQRGYSIRVFLPNGDPEGIKRVEKFNWSGVGIIVPRSLFARAKKEHPELDRPGVYLLYPQPGLDETSAMPQVYIGESDSVLSRLGQHVAEEEKDWWTHFIAFTSSGSDQHQNLNKAHVQYLESQLVARAQAAKRCVLKNGNTPQPPTLSKADAADTENFLVDLLSCLPVLGYTWFEMAGLSATGTVQNNDEEAPQRFSLQGKSIQAEGYESSAGFVVCAGSQAAKESRPSISENTKNLRMELLNQGVLRDEGTCYVFTQDYAFSAPSSAASVLMGGSTNGRTAWQTAEGRTLKAIQEAQARN